MSGVKRWLIILSVLCFLFTTSAAGEGILPVLATPLPSFTEAISLHEVLGMEEPEPRQMEDGGTEYKYTGILYEDYVTFGEALADNKYSLTDSKTDEDGTVVATVCKEDQEPITVRYLQETREMTVQYPLRMTAKKADPDNPYKASYHYGYSNLPELTQAISLHSATGAEYSRPVFVDNQYVYTYENIGYACYNAFSVQLSKEGYSLVSSEVTDDGFNRAEVANGDASLVFDYNLETGEAVVSYPVGVHARDIDYYGDFIKVRMDEPLELLDGVTAAIEGWDTLDKYQEQKGVGTYVGQEPAEGQSLILVSIDINYNNPEARVIRNMLSNITVRYDDEVILEEIHGKYDPEDAMIHCLSDSEAKLNTDFTFGIILKATEEQAKHPEKLSITFTDPDRAVKYIYRLEDEDLQSQDRDRARWGVAMTVEMIARAVDILEEPEARGMRAYMESFAEIEPLSPDKILIIQVKNSQIQDALTALGAEGSRPSSLASALARMINNQFDEVYTNGADEISSSASGYDLAQMGKAIVIALPYGDHIAVACIADGRIASSMIISDDEISAGLNEEDVLAQTEILGISGLKIRIYEGEEAAALLSPEKTDDSYGWYSSDRSAEYLMKIVNQSESRFVKLFHRLLHTSFSNKMISDYLIGQNTVPARVLRMISDQLYQRKAEDDNDVNYMIACNNLYPSDKAGTVSWLPELGDILPEEETQPDPAGTYQFVVTKCIPNNEPRIVYDWPLEAGLPSACIPENPEDAEYIIHIEVTYADEPDVSNGAVSLFYPHAHLTIHRASDGALLKDYGTYSRTLNGMTMLPYGNNYWDHTRDAIWGNISAIFK